MYVQVIKFVLIKQERLCPNIGWIVQKSIVSDSDTPSKRPYCKDVRRYKLHSTYALLSYRGLNNAHSLMSIASIFRISAGSSVRKLICPIIDSLLYYSGYLTLVGD